MNEAEREAEIDRRVQRRLRSDAAYRNAEDAEAQSEREAVITREEEEQDAIAREERRIAELDNDRDVPGWISG
jgi:hypothetical protein